MHKPAQVELQLDRPQLHYSEIFGPITAGGSPTHHRKRQPNTPYTKKAPTPFKLKKKKKLFQEKLEINLFSWFLNFMLKGFLVFVTNLVIIWLNFKFELKFRRKTHFRPYIFTRFPFWSLSFFFTAFSPYLEKRLQF